MEKYNAIECPKCRRRFLRKAIPQKPGFEFFCDKCHLYFGIKELMIHWGINARIMIMPEQKLSRIPFPVLTPCHGEPVWDSKEDRDTSYQEVSEMLMGIEAYRGLPTIKSWHV